MSDGIKWAYEQREAEEAYKKHVASGKFSKNYLESDITRTCTKEEIDLLAFRLVHHYLGGWEKFIEKHMGSLFGHAFTKLSKKAKADFVERWSLEAGLEVGPTKKLDKLRKKIKEMESIMHERSET